MHIVSEIEPPIAPYLIIDETYEFNGEAACNLFTGLYQHISSNEMNAIDFTEDGEDCGIQLHNYFEGNYFGFIEGGFWYSITQDGTGLVLSMENGFFGHALFKSYPLSVNALPQINSTFTQTPPKTNYF